MTTRKKTSRTMGTFNAAAAQRALRKAVRQALVRHKKLGQSIVVEQDGKIVRIPPEKIPV